MRIEDRDYIISIIITIILIIASGYVHEFGHIITIYVLRGVVTPVNYTFIGMFIFVPKMNFSMMERFIIGFNGGYLVVVAMFILYLIVRRITHKGIYYVGFRYNLFTNAGCAMVEGLIAPFFSNNLLLTIILEIIVIAICLIIYCNDLRNNI